MFQFLLGSAQPYLNNSCVWTESSYYHNSTEIYQQYFRLYINGDTTINNQLNYKLYKQGYDSVFTLSGRNFLRVDSYNFYVGALREAGKKFYLNNAELYDFNVAVGDTIFGYRYVESVETIYLGNEPRKRFSLKLIGTNSTHYLIEGVGALGGFLRGVGLYLGGSSKCFQKGAHSLIFSPTYAPCAALVSTTATETVPKIDISPNPMDDKIILKLSPQDKKITLRLYSIQGQLLKTATVAPQKTEFELTMQDIASGLYFLHFEQENKNWVEKVIKSN